MSIVACLLVGLAFVAALERRLDALERKAARRADLREIEVGWADYSAFAFGSLCSLGEPAGTFHHGTGECFGPEGGSMQFIAPFPALGEELETGTAAGIARVRARNGG